MADTSQVRSSPAANNKHYQWMLHDRHQWKNIDHDSIIETHYCQPGAKGIKICTRDYGSIFLDFNKMIIEGTNMKLFRKITLLQNELEEYGWYFHDNMQWKEYGCQTSSNVQASVTSRDIEQMYQQNPSSSSTFTAGRMKYVIDFSAMTQTNLQTNMKRGVRRRPKLNSIIQNVKNSLPNSFPNGTGSWIWQYKGNGGVWTDFKSGQGEICSVNSDDVERAYQQNQQGQLQFTAVGHHFTIDFSGMHIFSNGLEGNLEIRRLPANNTNMSSVNTVTSWTWQFMGEEGVWTDFKTNIGHGRVCSVSSSDVEMSYQQNPQGQLQFTAGRFSYTLYFSGMHQVNNELGTKRSIRRISVHTTHQASGNYIWEFKDNEGYWTEYTQDRCSVSSQDIEQHYLQNPTGILQFTTGRFSYTLDFTAMEQQNMTTLFTRPVQRTLLG
ncbi:PAR12 polymerase, partial [Polypterus senegalus]|nr:PAR12 polymerase [Polypterus senegalus]